METGFNSFLSIQRQGTLIGLHKLFILLQEERMTGYCMPIDVFFFYRKIIVLLYMLTSRQEKQLFLNMIYAVSLILYVLW